MIKRIYLEITNACNFNCPFCENPKGNRFMSLNDFKRIVDEIKEITPYIYLHVLGEPLFHPFFDEFLDYLDHKKMYVQLVTNGSLIHKYDFSKHPSIRKLAISIHSMGKDDSKYFENIDKLLNHNHDYYLDLRFYEKDKLATSVLNYLDNLKSRYTFNPTKLKEQFKIADKTYVSFNDFFKWPLIDDPYVSNIGTCHGGRDMLAILSNGDVTICCLDPMGHNKLGNIYESSLKEIIDSKQYKKVVNDLKNNQLNLSLCQRCTYHQRFD